MGKKKNPQTSGMETLPARNQSKLLDDSLDEVDSIEEGGAVVEEAFAADSNKDDSHVANVTDDIEPGGEVEDLFEKYPTRRGAFVKKEENVENTAAKLAFILVVILGAAIAIHYVAVVIVLLTNTDAGDLKEKLDAVERIFNTVLPAVTGLVGTAVAYYFGRQRRGS